MDGRIEGEQGRREKPGKAGRGGWMDGWREKRGGEGLREEGTRWKPEYLQVLDGCFGNIHQRLVCQEGAVRSYENRGEGFQHHKFVIPDLPPLVYVETRPVGEEEGVCSTPRQPLSAKS